MKTNRVLLEKSVQVLEKRFALRALRSLPVFRKQLAELGKDGAPLLLSKVIQTWFAQRAVQGGFSMHQWFRCVLTLGMRR